MDDELTIKAPKPTLVDRVVEWVAPVIARKREVARREIAVMRKYDAVQNTRLRRKREDHRDADSINDVSIIRLRAQARHLEENHDVAGSVLNTLEAGIIGDGIRTVPMAKRRNGELAEAFNTRITNLWREWQRKPEVTWEHDWSSLQTLVGRAWLRDGEDFCQEVIGTGRAIQHGTMVPYSLEPLEADFCPVEFTDPQRRIVQGVEKNTWRRPVRYHIYKRHPGHTLNLFDARPTVQPGGFFFAPGETKTVPAERMIHLKHVRRFNQTRGVSVFAAAFTRLQDLKDFEESERVAARIAAAFALAINKSSEYAGHTSLSSGKLREIGIAPGIIVDNLQPGEKVESLSHDRPNNQLGTFRKAMLQAVAGGTGASYSSVARDYSGTYSAQRQELIESTLLYSIMRSRFVGTFVDRTYRTFVEMAIAAGLVSTAGVDPETIFDVEHRGHGVPYIDPQKEVNADLIAMQAGLFSRTGTILRRGGDPAEVRRQIKQEREQDSLDELVFSSDWANAGGGSSTGMTDDATAGEGEDGEGGDADGKASADFRQQVDAYGVGVRSGVLTPQVDDELHFRKLAGVPKLSKAAQDAWDAEKVRRPVTLAPPPDDDDGDGEDGDGDSEA